MSRCPICNVELPLPGSPGTAPAAKAPDQAPGKTAGKKEAKNADFRPFCSRRCQLVDLGNWLGERYVVPGPSVDPNAEVDPTAASSNSDE